MNHNMCNNCGGDYEYRHGRWVCRACGAYKPEEISNEEVTLLYTASQKLRLAEFYEAEQAFDDIVRQYPQNPGGYWGRLMARYGIKYEDDFDGRRIPTCYSASIESILNDPDYKKAQEYADKETKEYYVRQAEYIERVRKEWVEKASKEKPYDIFICYKDSDLANGIERTPDSYAAQDLYIHLTNKGYRVFYSHESLRDKVGEKYEPYIFNALSTAKVMLVYGSKPEYITSTWLKNEWTRYEKRIKAGEKKPNSLLVACDGFSPNALPTTLSARQCFDASRKSFYSDLDEVVDNLLKEKKVEAEGAPVKKKSKAPLLVTILTVALLAVGGFAVWSFLGQNNIESAPSDQSDSSNQNELAQPCAHVAVIDAAVAPTCTETGLAEGSHCSVCDEILVPQETIEARGHTEVADERTEPNCVNTGLTEGAHCSVCEEILVKQDTIDALGHNHVLAEAQPASEDSVALEYTCTACGDAYTETVPSTSVTITEQNRSLVGYTGIPGQDLIIPAVFQFEGTWYRVTSIGESAFYDCTGLTSIVIPDSVTSIGNTAFQACTSLTSITLPSGVTSIGFGWFAACTSLTSITLPNGVTEIDEYMFAGCTNLTSITIPDSVTIIAPFRECTSLTSITFEGTVVQWNAVTKTNNWNYNIPATKIICSDGTVSLS